MAFTKKWFLLILPLLWGCSLAAEPGIQTTQSTAAVPFPADPRLPGTKVPIRVLRIPIGQVFSIILPSNPTTGYQWQLEKAPDSRILTEAGHEYLPEQPQRAGSGGNEIWRFKTCGIGRTAISMQYVRPWKTDEPLADARLFAVIVLKKE